MDRLGRQTLTETHRQKGIRPLRGEKKLATDPHRNTQTKEVLGRFAVKKYKNLGRGFSPEGFTKFESLKINSLVCVILCVSVAKKHLPIYESLLASLNIEFF